MLQLSDLKNVIDDLLLLLVTEVGNQLFEICNYQKCVQTFKKHRKLHFICLIKNIRTEKIHTYYVK